MFSEANVTLLKNIIEQDLLKAIGETLYMTFLPTILAFIVGLPLGVLLVTGDDNGIHPLPRPLMAALNVIINLLRSVPFLILLVVVLPLSKLFVGTTVGSKAIIVPLAIAAFPFIARLVETSIREVDQGVVEARRHGRHSRRRRSRSDLHQLWLLPPPRAGDVFCGAAARSAGPAFPEHRQHGHEKSG